jgi:fucose permease
VAVACVAAAGVSLVAVARHPRGSFAQRPEPAPFAGTPSFSPPGPRGDRLLTPTLAALAIGAALYVGAEIGLSTWMSVLLERELGAAPGPAAAGLSLLWLGLGAGRLAAGFVAARMEDVTLLRWALGLATMLQALLLLAPESWLVMASSFGLGLCFGPVFPTLVSAATSACPRRSAAVMAVVVAVGALGGAVFPASIGWAADTIGLRPALWTGFALLLADALLVTGLAPRRKPA